MPKLSEAQRTWVDDFLGKSGSTPLGTAAHDHREASGPKPRGTLIDIGDLEGHPGVQRDNPNLQYPTRHKMVQVIDLDQGKQYEVTAQQVNEIKKSPDYIDNFKELRAQPDWMELKIDRIEFIYSSGKKYLVEMDSVDHGLNASAQYYGRKGGLYYPRDANGNTLIDAVNTPHVVGGKEWIDKEIARRKQQREEIAWVVYTFAGAVASLGGAAGGGKGGGGVRPPAGGRPLPRTGGRPTGGKPTTGGSGGGGGKTTGGGGGGGGTPTKPTKAYPARRPPTTDALPPRPIPDADMRRGYIQASRDMKRSHTDPKGVWDQSAFTKNPKLKESLDAFAGAKKPGDKGFSVKNLDVTNKKPEKLHNELQAAGFEYHREPLVAFEAKGVKHYRLRQSRPGPPGQDGKPTKITTTTNKDDPDIVPHDIYKHPDGGLVRVKPEGDPNGRRPRPQVSKSVLHDSSKGTGFENEMFKVTNDGQAVPKLPTADAGMKQAPRGSTTTSHNDGYVDAVMTAAHPDLSF